MERGGSYRGRGTGGRGGRRGGGRGRGGGRDGGSGGGEHSYQRVSASASASGQGRGGIHWNQTYYQAGPNEGTEQASTRGGYAGGRGGGRRDWVPRPPPQEAPSYSNVAGPAGRGGGSGGPGGGVWRRPWGTGPAHAQPAGPQFSTPAFPRPVQPITDSVANVSEQLASTSLVPANNSKHVPIRRPDGGGVAAVTTVSLRVNHFPVNFNPDSIVRHYDVDVKPLEPSRRGRPPKLPKTLLSVIRKKLFIDAELPLSMTAYDGEKNIFSAVVLPEGEFRVELSEDEDMRPRGFIFSIKLVNELKFCKLRDYLTHGQGHSIPREILQGMDVVMKENPIMHMIPVGRSFHPSVSRPEDNLGGGITASRGIQHSLKPTSQGLALCLDYSVLAFRKKMPVIQFLEEHIHGFNVNRFQGFRRQVERVLRNLKVTVTHRRTKQKYTIVGLTNHNTRNLTFQDANAPQEHIRLVDYFQERYNRHITYLDIPCLDFSRNNRMNYVPMEFCVLAEGQVYPKEYLDRNAAMMLKRISLAKPRERQSKICNMVRSQDGPCGYVYTAIEPFIYMFHFTIQLFCCCHL